MLLVVYELFGHGGALVDPSLPLWEGRYSECDCKSSVIEVLLPGLVDGFGCWGLVRGSTCNTVKNFADRYRR